MGLQQVAPQCRMRVCGEPVRARQEQMHQHDERNNFSNRQHRQRNLARRNNCSVVLVFRRRLFVRQGERNNFLQTAVLSNSSSSREPVGLWVKMSDAYPFQSTTAYTTCLTFDLIRSRFHETSHNITVFKALGNLLLAMRRRIGRLV